MLIYAAGGFRPQVFSSVTLASLLLNATSGVFYEAVAEAA